MTNQTEKNRVSVFVQRSIKGGIYMSKLKGVGLALASVFTVVSVAVQADPVAISTTAAVAQIGEAQTAIGAIGAALISMAALVLGYRWVKANFF